MRRIISVRGLALGVALSAIWGLAGSAKASETIPSRIATLYDLHQKTVALHFLSDDRAAPLLEQILGGFEPRRRDNFRANITGNYRKTILDNYAVSKSTRERTLVQALSENGLSQIASSVQLMRSQKPPVLQAGFLTAVEALAKRVKFLAVRGETEGASEAGELLGTYLKELKAHAEVPLFEAGAQMFEGVNPGEIPIWWFDDHHYEVLKTNDEIAGPASGALDLNSAEVEDLVAISGIGPVLAKRIVAYREEHGGFAGVSEVSRIKGITEKQVVALSTVLRVVPVRRAPKAWTVMVYINGDNNLEGAGVKDVNEMERIGSTKDVNIVVQIDRQKGHSGDSLADGNWSGTRRYYVRNDDDPRKITSPMIADLGEVDMGQPETLLEFGRSTIDLYPAKKYAVVVWNHGYGWKSISDDETEGNSLNMLELMGAIEGIAKHRSRQDCKDAKLEIVDLDACLMSVLSVGYQLRDSVDILVASQELEPGDGMAYDKYLAELVKHPGMQAERLARIMVETFVKSYAFGGNQVHPSKENDTVTKAAIKLDKLEPLVKLVGRLAVNLSRNYKLYSQILAKNAPAFRGIQGYIGEYYDIYHLAETLESIEETPDSVKRVCAAIRELIGYPKRNSASLDAPVVVSRKTPGNVIWGIDGWSTPNRSMWPQGSSLVQSRAVRTPLRGPDSEGNYKAVLGNFSLQKNPWNDRMERVRSYEYFVDYKGKRLGKMQVVTGGEDYRIAKSFPSSSPVLIEGHTQGQGNAHGLSIYLPPPLDYSRMYEALDFSKKTKWDELISKIPVYQREGKVLLAGVITQPGLSKSHVKILETLGYPADVLTSRDLYGKRYRKILTPYADGGVVVLDRIAKNSGDTVPDWRDVEDFLDEEGKILFFSDRQQKLNFHTPYFRNVVGSEFKGFMERVEGVSFADATEEVFPLGGEESTAVFTGVIEMIPTNGATPFMVTDRGKVVATARDLGNGRGKIVYLGFRLDALSSLAQREIVTKKILEYLDAR